jgi:transcriptional regulator with PAS, ATPase and Fis domain
VKVDLGSVPATLFESELFGHVKGAFTDAKNNRAGKFEIAFGGSLFLDEIGNLPLSMQSKLLSVIQDEEFCRLGSNEKIKTDVRLICATNLPYEKLNDEKIFRRDLLYRINTLVIHLPPLRERKDDIPLLVDFFIKKYAKKYHKKITKISKDAIKKLQKYHWPGNVRELEHIIERSLIMSENQELKTNDILLNINTAKTENVVQLNLEEIEKNAINNALIKAGGNLSETAKILGIGRTTLYRKMEKYGL